MKQQPTKRQQIKKYIAQLKKKRITFEQSWKDLARFASPASVRLDTEKSKTNDGSLKYDEIYDSTATLALRTLSSGMMSGLTSPSRPWFVLSLKDSSIQETDEVKEWLDQVTRKMREIFAESNIYNTLAKLYHDIGLLGTGAASVEPDPDDVILGTHYPVGQYWLAQDHRGRINVFYREFSMTVEQIVEKWVKQDDGTEKWENVSLRVKTAWENFKEQDEILVGHLIRPNREYNPKKLESKFKKYESLYFEVNEDKDEKFLSQRGFDFFPILAPRWSVYDGDIYGTDSPGMLALGDIKQLQFGEKQKLNAIDKKVDPPMIVPSNMKDKANGFDAGETIYEDVAANGSKGIRSAYEVNINLADLHTLLQETRFRIKEALHENTFKMISNLDRSDITAREIAERKEEKLLVVGPVLEQLNKDLLNPLIDIGFEIGLARGEFPPPPKELQGKGLQVEYKSMMEQAQKAVEISILERFYGFVMQIIQANPESAIKIEFDEFINVAAKNMGVTPKLLRSDERIKEMKKQIQQQQQQAAAAQAKQAALNAAEQLGRTNVGEGNALDAMLEMSRTGDVAGVVPGGLR